MKCLVSGGAGFIGSHIVDRLIKEGHEVIILDDFSAGKQENIQQHKDSPKVQIVKRSISEDLNDIFQQGIDIVFHLAALPRVQFSIENPKETHEVNVNGTLNLLQACKEHNVKRFVFSSSSAIFGDQDKLPLIETMIPNPMSPYALHKLIGEEYCTLYYKLYGIKTVSLRYFNVYGARQDPEGGYALLIPKFMKIIGENKQPVINGDGEQTRDFAYVGDVVEANMLAATTDNEQCFGQAFNIGSNNNISVNTVTNTLLELFNSDIKPIYGPAVIEPKHTLADTTKAKEFLNWEPKTQFEEGLKDAFEDFKNN